MTKGSNSEPVEINGGCHCGNVAFRIKVSPPLQVIDCNCSICRATGFRHLIVDTADFELLAGGDSLTSYAFNTKTARHLFCSNCGVKSFYRPRSHPDAYSVNFRCLRVPTGIPVEFSTFDGDNWEASIDSLR